MGKSRLLREFERRLVAHPSAPTVRTGRCLPYGSGIVFWALGEVLRAECGIVESDSSEEAWQKLRAYVAELMGGESSHSDREAALIGRLLGIDVPAELVPDEDDPERMREAFLAALRRGIEAIAPRRPFVIAFEDIHWADDGMLDAIEHLAQWVRAPLMLVCLARDELLDRRPSWGGGRRSATQLMLSPLSDEHSRDARARAPAAGPRGGARRGRALGRQPAVRRGDGAPDRRGGHDRGGRAARHRAGRARGAARLARAVRAAAGAAGVGGGPHVPRGRARRPRRTPRVATSTSADLASGEGHPRRPAIDSPLGRARAGVQARADPRRGLRDAAQGGPLAEALRGRRLPRGARRRPHRRGGGAARRALRPRGGARPRERAWRRRSSSRCATRALRFLEEAGDAAAQLYANREAAAHYRHARAICPESAARGRRADRREARRRVAPARPRGRGDRRLVGLPRVAPRPGGPRAGGRPAPQDRRGAVAQGRAQGGDRALPEGHQPAEGRPAADRARAALRGGGLAVPPHRRQHARHLRVREGAAAGRAARRDARRQPRARDLRARVRPHRRHREGAPEPGARGGAGARLGRRRDDPGAVGARPPARDLRGRHGRARARSTRRRSRSPSRWACCPPRSSCTPGSRSSPPTAPTGSASRSRPRRAPTLAEREGLVGKLCLPYALRGLLRWREGRHRRGDRALPPRARAGRAGGLVRDRLPGAVRARDRAARPGRPRRRHRRARPGDRGVRARRA